MLKKLLALFLILTFAPTLEGVKRPGSARNPAARGQVQQNLGYIGAAPKNPAEKVKIPEYSQTPPPELLYATGPKKGQAVPMPTSEPSPRQSTFSRMSYLTPPSSSAQVFQGRVPQGPFKGRGGRTFHTSLLDKPFNVSQLTTQPQLGRQLSWDELSEEQRAALNRPMQQEQPTPMIPGESFAIYQQNKDLDAIYRTDKNPDRFRNQKPIDTPYQRKSRGDVTRTRPSSPASSIPGISSAGSMISSPPASPTTPAIAPLLPARNLLEASPDAPSRLPTIMSQEELKQLEHRTRNNPSGFARRPGLGGLAPLSSPGPVSAAPAWTTRGAPLPANSRLRSSIAGAQAANEYQKIMADMADFSDDED